MDHVLRTRYFAILSIFSFAFCDGGAGQVRRVADNRESFISALKKYALIGFLLCLTSNQSSAQTTDETITNSNFWLGFEFDLPTKKDARWGGYAEGIMQRANFLTHAQGWYASIGATYFMKQYKSLSGGIALQYSVPYDDASLPYALPDYRLWQQFMIKNAGKINPAFKWANRFRFEEKWLGRRYDNTLRTEGYDYFKNELMFRWLIRVLYYPTKHLGFVVNNEVFFRLLSSVPDEKLFDQNRAYAGIVYAFDDERDYRVELGYVQQDVWNAADEMDLKVRVNHVFRIMFHIEIPPFKL